METMAEKLTRAQQTYSEAIVALNDARADFESGKGALYAKYLKEKEELETKISTEWASMLDIERRYQDAFKESGYVVTEQVDQLLTAKIKASEIHSSLCYALELLKEPDFDYEAGASLAANRYRAMYLGAYKAWVRVQAYNHLAEHGDSLGRILALAKHVDALPIEGPNGFRYYDLDQAERISDDVVAMRQAFVIDAIRECAEAHPEAESPTMPPELGTLDLGLFRTRQTLTPAEISRKKALLEARGMAA